MNSLDDVKAAIEPILTGLGFELVDATFKKEYGEPTLTVIIFKQGGVDLDACELAHNAIDEVLDKLDESGQRSYALSVSSMGLDRELKTADDFRRRAGEEIEVRLLNPVNKSTKLVGALISADDNEIVINKNNKNIKIDKKNVAKVLPYVKF